VRSGGDVSDDDRSSVQGCHLDRPPAQIPEDPAWFAFAPQLGFFPRLGVGAVCEKCIGLAVLRNEGTTRLVKGSRLKHDVGKLSRIKRESDGRCGEVEWNRQEGALR